MTEDEERAWRTFNRELGRRIEGARIVTRTIDPETFDRWVLAAYSDLVEGATMDNFELFENRSDFWAGATTTYPNRDAAVSAFNNDDSHPYQISRAHWDAITEPTTADTYVPPFAKPRAPLAGWMKRADEIIEETKAPSDNTQGS